jgi:predicted nucleic acid-binding protein
VTERVIDASVLAHALIGKTLEARRMRESLLATDCHAPHLIDAEVGNVLRKRARAGDVTPDQARVALRAASNIIEFRYPHIGALAESAWALRDKLSFYDALYVALAVRLDVPLLTGDSRLSRAPGLPCRIELVPTTQAMS